MKLRGQGSLEYLIIIAAVLAIAAIVVLFLTGAFTSTSATGGISVCKDSASKCATEKATSIGATCAYCTTGCLKNGVDVVNTLTNASGTKFNIGESYCKIGQADRISAGATGCGNGIVEAWETCDGTLKTACTNPLLPNCNSTCYNCVA
ncbi:class III signal peptide-containing protein [Candidatus Micrarchaeota archaeon]|nr:class III signal peptide-containing protein [Candidatus Micrarchaeota archaeon]